MQTPADRAEVDDKWSGIAHDGMPLLADQDRSTAHDGPLTCRHSCNERSRYDVVHRLIEDAVGDVWGIEAQNAE